MTDAAREPRACNAFNLEGERCGQNTVGENRLCIWHDPDRVAEAAEARRLGQERYREVRAEEAQRAAVAADDLPPDLELSIPGLLRRLAWLHQAVAAGRIEPDTARELRATITQMRMLVRDRDVEDRLRAALSEVRELKRKHGARRAP